MVLINYFIEHPQFGAGQRDITSDFKSLGEFLKSCDCIEELPLLEGAKVKLKNLPNYTQHDLERIGLKFGPAKEIYDALQPYRPSTIAPNQLVRFDGWSGMGCDATRNP